jgi:hypothetical protein
MGQPEITGICGRPLCPPIQPSRLGCRKVLPGLLGRQDPHPGFPNADHNPMAAPQQPAIALAWTRLIHCLDSSVFLDVEDTLGDILTNFKDFLGNQRGFTQENAEPND